MNLNMLSFTWAFAGVLVIQEPLVLASTVIYILFALHLDLHTARPGIRGLLFGHEQTQTHIFMSVAGMCWDLSDETERDAEHPLTKVRAMTIISNLVLILTDSSWAVFTFMRHPICITELRDTGSTELIGTVLSGGTSSKEAHINFETAIAPLIRSPRYFQRSMPAIVLRKLQPKNGGGDALPP
ncbi:hypothetical protein FB45DRAFT_1096449 [Roridomyces roridus]|uniref:Uncharacterized protein n=1 Tax=Roridomyces roridus TaxID=1738132 RepID=A0AAD7F804_9AGAR|nr:hypothetical protein FB45DRAFT_1096449 [Roridomyces roridus]